MRIIILITSGPAMKQQTCCAIIAAVQRYCLYNKFILQTLHSSTYTYFHVNTHTRARARVHTRAHSSTHAHAQTHTLTHTQSDTYTQTYTPPRSHINVHYINILTNI